MMDVDSVETLRALEAASDRYETALVANDTATLDALFWHDARVTRISPRDELVGIETIRAFRAARPTHDLARERLSRSIQGFGDSTGVVTVIFRRTSDGRVGRQSQTWVRFGEDWRIVHAHIGFREQA